MRHSPELGMNRWGDALAAGSPYAALIAELEKDHRDQALEQAFNQLTSGTDLPLLLATVRALVRQGVPGLAVRLLKSAGGLLADIPEKREGSL